MSKYQEALDYLKAFSEQWVVNYEKLTKGNINNVDFTECDEHSKTLQELVDKATPMKIRYKRPSYDSHLAEHGIEEGDCPNCDELVTGNLYGSYCGCCGQAIDWSD